jgi:hypothetical protein
MVRSVVGFTSGSCIALQLQLWLASSSSSKVGQVSFEYSPQSLETSSWLCFGWLTCHPTPALSLYYFIHWEFGSLPHPPFSEQIQHSTSPLLLVLDYNLLFMLFSFFWGGGFNLPRGWTGLCSWGVTCGACCSPVGFAGLHRQLWNQVWGEMACHFSKCRHFLRLGSVQQGVGRLCTV